MSTCCCHAGPWGLQPEPRAWNTWAYTWYLKALNLRLEGFEASVRVESLPFARLLVGIHKSAGWASWSLSPCASKSWSQRHGWPTDLVPWAAAALQRAHIHTHTHKHTTKQLYGQFLSDVVRNLVTFLRVYPDAGLTYIVVGGEGATNFPRDDLHIGFKKYMQETPGYLGFRASVFGHGPRRPFTQQLPMTSMIGAAAAQQLGEQAWMQSYGIEFKRRSCCFSLLVFFACSS